MKKTLFIGAALLIVSCWCIPAAFAGPDQYPGDTAIYGGIPVIQPNVLLILDTSGSMGDDVLSGLEAFDHLTTYNGDGCSNGSHCSANTVYQCNQWTTKCTGGWSSLVSLSSVNTSCPTGTSPKSILTNSGFWSSSSTSLRTSGACRTSGSGIYATGNWLNWNIVGGQTRPKIDIAKDVLTNLVTSTTGVRFGLMRFNNDEGGRILSATVSGSTYKAEVKDMDAIFSGTKTNRDALVTAIGTLDSGGWTPLAETLYEAMLYYKGAASYFNSGTYTSPIQGGCQKNYIVFITDGMSTYDRNTILKSICNNGDCDGDGHEPYNDSTKSYPDNGSDYLDDIVRYLNINDMSTTYAETQNVVTYGIGFGLGVGMNASTPSAVKLLNETAQNGSGGNHATNVPGTQNTAFMTDDQTALQSALTAILSKIFEVNTSFVAPVVPVSPENRTYSGSRVYMGFFMPQTGKMWLGNLKKYGLNSSGNLVDSSGQPATNADGTFKSSATSYWSTSADAGNVDSGGVGQLLADRDLATDPRQMYTYLSTSMTSNLTDPKNGFTVSNTDLTRGLLNMSTDTDRDNLIKFVHGIDVYDDNADGIRTDPREWRLGDVLHSKPVIVHYKSYTDANEGSWSSNNSMIFVGSNDGMLHAFKDYNGQEAWAFVPPDLLGNLHYLHGTVHTYYVDASPSLYIYDANQNGIIESGDKVVIVFGERRGGGTDSGPTGGSYYALDVTDPLAPVFLWSISNTQIRQGTTTTATTMYGELGETWSEPKIVKIKLSGGEKIVAFIGAGYDNPNEDGRYGVTQTYSGASSVSLSDYGDGVVTSINGNAPLSPKGRGVYAVEVASLSGAGVPSFGAGGAKVWGYTNADNSGMTFSIPSEISAMDTNDDGYADRLYVGDVGGNMWRFNVGSDSTSAWTSQKIFSSNPGSGGSTDTGRKIFYRPAVSTSTSYTWVDLGTGDREHPLNRAVVDRMYAMKDQGQIAAKAEGDMTDVTLNLIQTGTTVQADAVRTALNATTNYGWYIKLSDNVGEKVLATPSLFSGVLYYTTYTPNAVASSDPCKPGNLGTGRYYAVDYDTAAASIDLTGTGSITRGIVIGQGIPSGMVMIITTTNVSGMLAAGGNLIKPPTKSSDNIKALYWRIR